MTELFTTRNGAGDLVAMSVETYESRHALLELYGKLAEAEGEIANGAQAEEFFQFARKLRTNVHGKG